MKVKFTLLFFTILAIHTNCFSQNLSGIITYKVNRLDNFTKESSKRPDLLKSLKKNQNNVYFILSYKNLNSYYKGYTTKSEDENEVDNIVKEGLLSIGFTETFYNNEKKQILFRSSDKYIDLSRPKDETWEITNETKKIQNIDCYKAIRIEKEGKPTIAWFAPSIPIPFGPAIFNNLPGLILEVEWNNFIYYVTKINLNPKEDIVINWPIGKQIIFPKVLKKTP